MAHKDFTFITSQHSGFLQMKSKIGRGKIKIQKDASQKLMQGDLLTGKISLGLNFSMCWASCVGDIAGLKQYSLKQKEKIQYAL